MSFEIIISSAVVSALIAAIGGVVTTGMANKAAAKTAKETTNSEIEKLKLTWDREDIVSSDDEFAEMAATVARFVNYNNTPNRADAMAIVAAIRSKESGSLGEYLDFLYNSIQSNKQKDADKYLTMAINEKRNIKKDRV